ncbi:MAG: hypothetical protein P8077_08285 [Gammaproteobacteria bacterium]
MINLLSAHYTATNHTDSPTLTMTSPARQTKRRATKRPLVNIFMDLRTAFTCCGTSRLNNANQSTVSFHPYHAITPETSTRESRVSETRSPETSSSTLNSVPLRHSEADFAKNFFECVNQLRADTHVLDRRAILEANSNYYTALIQKAQQALAAESHTSEPHHTTQPLSQAQIFKIAFFDCTHGFNTNNTNIDNANESQLKGKTDEGTNKSQSIIQIDEKFYTLLTQTIEQRARTNRQAAEHAQEAAKLSIHRNTPALTEQLNQLKVALLKHADRLNRIASLFKRLHQNRMAGETIPAFASSLLSSAMIYLEEQTHFMNQSKDLRSELRHQTIFNKAAENRIREILNALISQAGNTVEGLNLSALYADYSKTKPDSIVKYLLNDSVWFQKAKTTPLRS